MGLFKQAYIPYLMFLGGVVLIFIWARLNRKEGFADVAEAPYKFNMYYADWCPHCHKAKPEFEKLGAIQTIGGKHVVLSAIEAEKEPAKVLEKVSGYPTIHLYDPANKLIEEYQGERTAVAMQAFLDAKMKALPKA